LIPRWSPKNGRLVRPFFFACHSEYVVDLNAGSTGVLVENTATAIIRDRPRQFLAKPMDPSA